MNGIDVFAHSVRQVFGNLSAALKISAILYLIQFAVSYWFGSQIPEFGVGGMSPGAMTNIPWGSLLIFYVVLLITGLWIAVAWHRYILLNEEPSSILPALRFDRMLAYFGYSLLIGLIMIPVAFVLSFIVSLLVAPLLMSGGANMFGIVVVGLLIYVPLIVIVYRLSVVLPAAALEENLGIGGAWERTKGTTGTMLVLAIISALGFLLINLPVFWMSPQSIFVTVWTFGTQWIIVMVGVSILTTLYGHYVEDRPLV
jgi:hypothetical protein